MGYLSTIFLEAKFGASTIISEANFGAKPPDLLIWKYPPGKSEKKCFQGFNPTSPGGWILPSDTCGGHFVHSDNSHRPQVLSWHAFVMNV